MSEENWQRVCAYLSSVVGDPFFKVVLRPENSHEELPGLLEWPACLSLRLRDQRTSPLRFELPVNLCLQSKITNLILSFQVPCGSMNILFASRIFLFMAGYRNLHASGFFPLICWSYLRKEISVTLSIGNKLYSRHHILYFSFLGKHIVGVILWPPWIC